MFALQYHEMPCISHDGRSINNMSHLSARLPWGLGLA